MNSTDRAWLENRIQAAVDDDHYLDREEEKRIKEESASRGIPTKDVDLVIRTELDRHGAACERVLVDELDRLLHQFTDNDRKLDHREERLALDKVVHPAAGKRKGLDPRVAEEYVSSYCRVNGVVRTTERNRRMVPLFVTTLVVVVAAGAVVAYLRFGTAKPVETRVLERKVVETRVVEPPAAIVSEEDKAEIDDLLRRASQYVEKAQYTDPPERSAKACLDRIRELDPKGQHRGADVKGLAVSMVDHYLELADKSHAKGDVEGTGKWLERAKLLNTNMELIREKEREFGLIRSEQ